MGVRSRLLIAMASSLAVGVLGTDAFASGAAPQRFAVVELFTSEGCSSCPPADAALARVERDAAGSRDPLLVLEWHVDYWDYLGWKDPYSSALATERQTAYARALGGSLYTPQAIINGTKVVSYAGDADQIEADARPFLSARPTVDVQVRAAVNGPSARIRATVTGARAGEVLVLALVERGLGATPTRGENAGVRLSHSEVVRTARVMAAGGQDVDLPLPAGLDPERSEVIAFIQDATSMAILGAGRASLSTTGAAIPQARSGRVTGRLVDARGAGVPAARLQLCNDRLCMPAVTDADGWFTLGGVPQGTYRVTLEDSRLLRSVTLGPGEAIALPAIRVPGTG